MKRVLKILSMILVGLSSGQAFAQVGDAKATLDSNLITIGDQVKLEIKLTIPATSSVNWPSFADTLSSHIEIIDKSRIDTLAKDPAKVVLRQILKVTSFDSGYWYIPPIPFHFQLKNDPTTYYAETKPVGIDVRIPKTDLKKDIKPIKPPLKAPITFMEILPWLLGVILLGLVIFVAVYIIRRRRMSKPLLQLRSKPKLPPHVVALEALENLRLKKLWQAGKVKDYYTELTDIIRYYIEGRYSIQAMEMTSEEIMQGLKNHETGSEIRKILKDTLVLADLVKFAKAQPLPLENEQSLNQSIEFVKATKPAAELNTTEENASEVPAAVESKSEM